MSEPAPPPDNQFHGNLATVAWLLALPTGTMMLGGLVVFLYNLGPKQIAGMQHFASGILLAAIGWELAPSIKAESNIDKGAIIMGFLVGAAVLMFVGRYDFKHWKRCYGAEEAPLISEKEKEEEGKREGGSEGPKEHLLEAEDSEIEKTREVPAGLVFAVLLDGSIDGLLIGVAYVASGAAGLITAIALGIEMGLLGISTVTTLRKTHLSTGKILFLTVTLPLAILGAGMLGSTVLSGLSGSWFIAVISFGCAGLLYLVTEELMIEAHEDEETDRWYVSGLFFLGFLFVVVLSEYAPEDL
jgi:ZIP family zinc transporter